MTLSSSIRFAEYIKQLPSAWVFEHFLKGAGATRKILSSSMIDVTVKEFATASSLARRFDDLPFERQVQCTLIYLLGRTGLQAVEPYGLDDPLVKTFLVYHARSSSGAVRYFGFDEFEGALRSRFTATFIKAAQVNDQSKAAPTPKFHCVNDVTVMAALGVQGLLKRKAGSSGLMRATSIHLRKLTHDISAAGRVEISDYIGKLLVSYGLDEGMLVEQEHEYALNSACFERWMKKSDRERYEELIEFVTGYCGGWRIELFREVLARAAEKWLSMNVFPEDERKEALDAVKAFRFLGLIDLRRHGNDLLFARTRTLENTSSSEKGIVILPDFSAVIPQEISPERLYQFANAGTLDSLDRVYKGKIERTTINTALTRGLDGGRLLELLAQWQAPPNVIETVKEWIREFSRLYISSSHLIVSFDERVSMQLAAFEPLQHYLTPVKAHAFFRISQGDEPKVREILERMGFDPRMPEPLSVRLECEGSSLEAESFENLWEPVVELAGKKEDPPMTFRGTKYGAELKALDMNEVMQVIDYAILTGQQVIIDYLGSPYLKPNVYTIVPIAFQKGIEPLIDAEIPKTRSRKQFYVKKIRRIGVVPR